MANVKISGLPAASSVADANEFEINEAGTSKKVTGSQIASYVDAELNPLKSADIGSTVQAYDADTTKNDVANTFTANQTINADLTVDTSTLKVDSTNNRVGIGTASPSQALDVVGNIAVSGTVDGRDIATNIPSSLGTAGQILTVNTGATATEWADASGGGGAWNYINSTTFSNTSSYILNFNTLDSYDMYMVVLENVTPSNDNVEVRLYFGDNGASFDTARPSDLNSNVEISSGTISAENTVTLTGGAEVGSAAGENGVSGTMYLQNFNDSGIDGRVWGHVVSQDISGNLVQGIFAFQTETTAEDSVQIIFESGNLESGKAVLYGLNYS